MKTFNQKHRSSKLAALIIGIALITTPMANAHHRYEKVVVHNHGNNHHNTHHGWKKHHWKKWHNHHRNYNRVVVHNHHHSDAGAWIGGAILGAVVISAIENNQPREQVTVVKQVPSAANIVYRQLANGECYQVSYDANGTEYLQQVDRMFCGS